MKTNRLLFLSLTLAITLTGVLAVATPAAAQPPHADSPLAAYPGFGHHAEADEKQFEREELAREHLIARCMEREGFRYVPAPSIALEELASPSEAMAALRDDPNGRYERGLPEEERVRYRVSLYGVENPLSENADHQPDPAGTGGGCLGEAVRTLPGVFAAKAALQDAYDAMRRSVMSDLRVKAAERHWAACMAGFGHPVDASPRALEERQDAELAELVGPTEAELPTREALAALGEKHRAERQLTMRCARKVDLPGAVASVRAEHEARFVAEHRETLDRHLERFRAQQPLLESIESIEASAP